MERIPLTASPTGAVRFGKERLLVHCHRYNQFLHQALYDLDPAWALATMEQHARSVGYRLAEEISAVEEFDALSQEERVALVVAELGFGRVTHLQALPADGGKAKFQLAASHFTAKPLVLYGEQGCSCAYTGGLVAGLVAGLEGRPLSSLQAKETACCGQGADACQFEIEVGSGFPVSDLPRTDASPVQAPPLGFLGLEHPASAKILKGFGTLKLASDADGLIPAFGVQLAFQSSAYYAALTASYMQRVTREGRKPELASRAERMLAEAGHVCAFFTLGGIVRSMEWDALVVPYLNDREDAGEVVLAVMALAPALGWGIWSPQHAAGLSLAVHDGYEPQACKDAGLEGKTSYFVRGALNGLLNITSKSELHRQPGEALPESLYAETFHAGACWMTDEITEEEDVVSRFASRFRLPAPGTVARRSISEG